jgi:lysophospholipase L1-like esterase
MKTIICTMRKRISRLCWLPMGAMIFALSVLSVRGSIGQVPQERSARGQVDLARLQRVMARLRRGETIAMAALGGSITTGYAAQPPQTAGWAALVNEWWQNKAIESGGKVVYYNMGVSGTDSAFASARVRDHIIDKNIDLVFLEFAINDQWLDKAVRNRSYEGIVRQMMSGSDRALLCLYLNERGGPRVGQQAEQSTIAAHYGLPSVSWGDGLQALVEAGRAKWGDMFDGAETIHPNSSGHASIAGFITAFLEEVWKGLPADRSIPAALAVLPPPLYGDDFQFVKFYGSEDLAPLENDGWTQGSDVHGEWLSHGGSKEGWTSRAEGGHISFRLKGASVGVMYAESDQYRNADAWVEYPDGTSSKKTPLNCFVSYRSGYLGWAYHEVARNPESREFVLHVQVKKSRAADKGRLADVTGILVTGAR